jgi:AcrR family transcriptional regulator
MRVVKEPEERRNELIDTAEALFIEKGYDNTTVEEIVKKTEVAKGTFYHYFKSKNEILDAMLNRYTEEINESMSNIASKEGINAVEKIVRVFRFFGEYRNNRERFIGYIHEERNAHLHLMIENKFIPVFIHPFADMVEQGIQQGLFNTKYPREAALAVLTLGVQFGNTHENYYSTKEVERNVEAFIDILERIVGAESMTFLRAFKVV